MKKVGQILVAKRHLVHILLVTSILIGGCASTYNPRPMEEVPFKKRAQTKRQGTILVTAAVLSAEESEEIFGVPLYKKSIQPIWLEIENNAKQPVWFFPAGVDPEYFSPLEAAYMHRSGFSEQARKQMDQYFHDQDMEIYIEPGTARSGFVFTNLDEGTKTFNVDLVSEDHQAGSFTFIIRVPGLKVDHTEVDFKTLYSEDEIVTHDEKGLRKALENLPCCTTSGDGTEQGDPLNIVVIGNLQDVYHAFIRAGWDETETIYAKSAVKTAISFLFGGRYRYSPVSGLYVFGRRQDAALQKARETIHERNHLRLWLTSMRFEGKPVWIGQISRDIGVRFTSKTIVTHKIDPDVDETRAYLLQDLLYSQGLERFAYVKGVGSAPISEPRENLTGDPYFTDGYRVVMWVSSEPVSLEDIAFVSWEVPQQR